MMRFPEKAISSVIESSRVAQIEYNRKVLRSIVSSVIFCGKQNIALRGHMESSTDNNSKNRGNFLALLDFRAEGGDEIIAKHLRECARNATYTSATIQNDIIAITMEYLRNQIISETPEHAPFFTILADETTDVSNTEQLCISIRFVDETCSIHEEFLGFVSLARTTGEAVATSILEALQTWSLDVKNCRGQGYDGASSMSSAARGTQAFIRQRSPKAVYTHCNAHCLNLAFVHSCDIPMIRNMIGTLNEICSFFKFSPKRHELLAAVINNVCPNTRRTTLISLCRTRWVERHEAFEVFNSLFRAIVKTLEVMANERVYLDEYGSWKWDQETRTKANGFLAAVTQFQFIVTMITVMKCLSVLKPLSIQLQKRDSDIYKAYTQVSSVKSDVKAIREQIEVHFNRWYEASVELGKDVDVEPALPRIANRQRHRDNVPAATPVQYFQRSLCIPLMDHLIAQMDTYFSEIQMNVSKLMCLVPEVLVSSSDATIDAAIQFYRDDLVSPDVVDVELVRWRRKWSDVADKSSLPNSASATLRECDPIFFPNINVLLRILCTLPVTSAECERSFSTLKRLKTYLRSTMTTERQSGLAMMNIHYGRAIDIDEIINIFATRHPRRLLLKDILTDKQSE